MKKMILIIIVAIILTPLIFAKTIQRQEVTAQEIIDDNAQTIILQENNVSNWTKFFNENIKDKILTFVISALGVLSTLAVIYSKIKMSLLKLNLAKDELQSTATENIKEKKELEITKQELQQAKIDFVDAMLELKALQKNMNQVNEEYANIHTMLLIGFGNMKELVSSGIASEIAKVGKKNESQE